MEPKKRWDGYTSFSYLEPGVDYRAFELSPRWARGAVRLSALGRGRRAGGRLLRESVCVSLHDHCGITPADMAENDAYVREGREWYGYEGLAVSGLDAVFENFLDGTRRSRRRAGGSGRTHPRPRDAPGRRRAPDDRVRGRDGGGHPRGAPGTDRDGPVHGGRRDDRERARPPGRAVRPRRPDVRDRVQRVQPARGRREGSGRWRAHALRNGRRPADEPAGDGDRPVAYRRRDGEAHLRGERAARVPVAFGRAGAVLGAEAEVGRPVEGRRGNRRRDRDRGIAAHDDLTRPSAAFARVGDGSLRVLRRCDGDRPRRFGPTRSSATTSRSTSSTRATWTPARSASSSRSSTSRDSRTRRSSPT